MSASVANENWLELDEGLDTLYALRHVELCLCAVSKKPELWKWGALALHSALQGAMVCHLNGSANVGFLSEKSAKEWFAWDEKDRAGEIPWIIDDEPDEFGFRTRRLTDQGIKRPTTYMAAPRELFKRLSDENKRIEGGVGAVINVTDGQKWAFNRLSELRDEFTHFKPKGWHIEISGFPSIVAEIGALILSIAKDDYPFRHLKESELHEILRIASRLSQQS